MCCQHFFSRLRGAGFHICPFLKTGQSLIELPRIVMFDSHSSDCLTFHEGPSGPLFSHSDRPPPYPRCCSPVENHVCFRALHSCGWTGTSCHERKVQQEKGTFLQPLSIFQDCFSTSRVPRTFMVLMKQSQVAM